MYLISITMNIKYIPMSIKSKILHKAIYQTWEN